MDIGRAVIWFCIWFVFPVLVYAASAVGLYAAYAYGGSLLATLAYGLCTWIILWMFDGLGRVSVVDLSRESLFQRYIKPFELAWPGVKGDAARLRFAREELTRFVATSGSERPMFFGRYAETEIFPGQVLASGDYTQFIDLSLGPKWYAWACLVGLFLWPVTVPLAFVAVHAYGLYRFLID
jgi:hypothetical protein